MKSFIFVLLLFIAFLSACKSSPKSPEIVKKDSILKTVSYFDLNTTTKLTGALHVPLGTIVKLKCEIIDGDKTEIKQNMGLWLMKILEIDGAKADDNIILNFTHLTEDFNHNKSDEEKNSLIKENKILELIAYETGEFTGLPENYMNYTETRATTNFYFKTSLVVITTGFK